MSQSAVAVSEAQPHTGVKIGITCWALFDQTDVGKECWISREDAYHIRLREEAERAPWDWTKA